MARGISSCDGCEVGYGGVGVGCRECSSRLCITNSPPNCSLVSLSSADYDGKSYSSANREVGDVLYGRDDYEDMKDYKYKDDVLESMRMERDFKYKRHQDKKWRSFTQCFEFLKLTWCLRF